MAGPSKPPTTFYLNEQHELSRGEREGGGRLPQFHGVNWASKGHRIKSALESVSRALLASADPIAERHYFVLAKPVAEIEKKSTNKRLAKDGIISTRVRFDEDDSRVFRRLGMDLVDVTPSGDAIVHIEPERIKQLIATSDRLEDVGAREQARWASLDTFGLIPPELRLDEGWVASLRAHHPTEAVVEFQPLLSRIDIEALLKAMAAYLKPERREAIVGIGTDFSGRHWAKGKIGPESLRAIAKAFFSVQTLHSPLTSFIVATTKASAPTFVKRTATHQPTADISYLPTVAILDTGIPSDHSVLANYRRGTWIAPDSFGQAIGDHGSLVASRVVFGDLPAGDEPQTTPMGSCRFYDALVASGLETIDDKSVVPAIQTVVGTAPDVRVFNLSFDTVPLDQLESTKQREILLLVQDLDNLIFQNDVLVVVSAGNSRPGVVPNSPYPGHQEDPDWRLGAWARSFNSLTCGSFVGHLSPGGLVTTLGWPSPFTRVGPGIAGSPKPDYSENGGNTSPTMQFAPGQGVQGLTASGLWEDRCGTSLSAPILSRHAAFVSQALQKMCLPGARPYAVTTKAVLALTALPPDVGGPAKALAARTLGRGQATSRALGHPRTDRAILVWQGLLEGPGEIARVTVPIPKDWYNEAKSPQLRLIVSWDAPVNRAAAGLWATRKIQAQLKASPDTPALHGSRGAHATYPLIDRSYDLRKLPNGVVVDGDMWLLELSYEQIADYYLGMVFTPQQRVGFAIELSDASEHPVSPQASLQALPMAKTMTRLSISPQPIKAPVIVRPLS